MSIQAYTDSLTNAQAAEQAPMPFFAPVYQMLDSMSKEEALTFSASATPPSTWAEAQYIKGLLGLTSAPL